MLLVEEGFSLTFFFSPRPSKPLTQQQATFKNYRVIEQLEIFHFSYIFSAIPILAFYNLSV